MQDINPFLGYLMHEMINLVYILMFNSIKNYNFGITSQFFLNALFKMFSYSKQGKYMNVKSIGYEKMQFEIEQNATS